MITHICIIIYNRFNNLEHWMECWQKCDHTDAEIVVIHNHNTEDKRYSDLCEQYGVQYIRRLNIGYDIGAFQDVCKGRLKGFPEWERLLWIVDDAFPMSFQFVKKFNDVMKPGVGVACMEISRYVTDHIRTSGFMIDKSTAEQLTFPADPILTKEQCFHFEHRGKDKIFYAQILKMGLTVEMVAPQASSPLWDTGYHRRRDRKKEHEDLFTEIILADKVLFICPIYKTYPAIISSLIMQTHKNWILMLIHDGPDDNGIQSFVPEDPRIQFFETPKWGGCWGHYIRQTALEKFKDFADFIVVTNPDNYYCPTFLEYYLRGFEHNPQAVAVYCSQIIHSYTAWKVMECRLAQGFLDCGGVMVKSIVAAQVPWVSISDHSADWYWFEDIIRKFGQHRFQKVEGALFVHN